jgi:hypothetical protein
MKVKIQYTVDIDDVPLEVAALNKRVTDEILKASDISTRLDPLGSVTDYGKLSEAIRSHLLNADLILSDCEAILSGYVSAKHPPQDSQPSPDGGV